MVEMSIEIRTIELRDRGGAWIERVDARGEDLALAARRERVLVRREHKDVVDHRDPGERGRCAGQIEVEVEHADGDRMVPRAPPGAQAVAEREPAGAERDLIRE